MSRIRYLDIDELNDRLQELEDLEQTLESARTALHEYIAENGDTDTEESDKLREGIDYADQNFTDDERKELNELRELKDEVGESRRGLISDDGGPFVHCDDFEDYAQQLADDIGAIDHKAGWPLNCIDWAKAAKELSADYAVITYRGTDYYYRS